MAFVDTSDRADVIQDVNRVRENADVYLWLLQYACEWYDVFRYGMNSLASKR